MEEKSTRAFLSDILSTLASLPPPSHAESFPSNPLASAATSTTLKPLLLTLHALFPNELLPALDLLDRRLLTRFVLRGTLGAPLTLAAGTDAAPGVADGSTAGTLGQAEPTVYYVRSAAQADAGEAADRGRGRPRRSGGGESGRMDAPRYEVRLRAWNCSCPAFTFAAFGGGARSTGETANDGSGGGAGQEGGLETERSGAEFGGLRRGKDGPVCKHLLACVLVDRCAVFEGCVEEWEVGVEEMAGWAAGWVE